MKKDRSGSRCTFRAQVAYSLVPGLESIFAAWKLHIARPKYIIRMQVRASEMKSCQYGMRSRIADVQTYNNGGWDRNFRRN